MNSGCPNSEYLRGVAQGCSEGECTSRYLLEVLAVYLNMAVEDPSITDIMIYHDHEERKNIDHVFLSI